MSFCSINFSQKKNGRIQATENREMDSSQLYDAFRDILEIRMSQDEFQVYFKKVSQSYLIVLRFSLSKKKFFFRTVIINSR